jgi:DNA recombination protein RmuC
MGAEFLILLMLVLAGFGGIFWILNRQRRQAEINPQRDAAFLMLQNQINAVTRTLNERLSESTQILQQQFGTSTRIVQEVTERLVKLDETNRQVVNFADQLRTLQDILKNPKQRGILGEYSLEVILQNFFPHNYERQYRFRDGTVVDFVIRLRDKVVPIDSKFSLENYQRILESHTEAERARLEDTFKSDLKTRIDETAKYIKPEEGTMDFAIMFIPAEAVYYDLLVNKIGAIKSNTRDLIEYAMGEKRVVVVSPTSFLAYLQTVLQGLKALQIEESAREIRTRVEELGRHLRSYEEYMRKLGTHLGTTVTMYNSAYRELGKIDKDVLRITGERIGVEVSAIPAPQEEG